MLVSNLHGEVFENGQDKLFSVEEAAFGQPNMSIINININFANESSGHEIREKCKVETSKPLLLVIKSGKTQSCNQ